MPATTQRSNRAFRIAYLSDVARIIYTINFTAFAHGWAMQLIIALIPAAYTVLLFLAAMHRAGKFGYIGCAVAYDLLAPQIVKATGRKCSTRTLKRGLACLKSLGLVELRPWTMPDQIIRSGSRQIKIKGTSRVDLGGDQWCTRQLRIVVLTERAISLWDKATRSHGDRVIAHLPTWAKLALNSQNEQIDKSIMLESKSTNDIGSDRPRESVLDCEHTSEPTASGSPSNDLEGRPTCPPRSGDPSGASFEHQTSTAPIKHDTVESTRDSGGLSGDAPFSGKPPAIAEPIGCSRARVRIPRGAPNKTHWTVARLYILLELHKAIERFSTRQADAIYDRARFELSRSYPGGWPTTCDWAYWIGRFPSFSPSQRRYHMMRDIVPLLKNPAAITPNEVGQYNQWADPAEPKIEPARGTLAEYLEKLKNKFCGD